MRKNTFLTSNRKRVIAQEDRDTQLGGWVSADRMLPPPPARGGPTSGLMEMLVGFKLTGVLLQQRHSFDFKDAASRLTPRDEGGEKYGRPEVHESVTYHGG